jgi:hypothetical protein
VKEEEGAAWDFEPFMAIFMTPLQLSIPQKATFKGAYPSIPIYPLLLLNGQNNLGNW